VYASVGVDWCYYAVPVGAVESLAAAGAVAGVGAAAEAAASSEHMGQ